MSDIPEIQPIYIVVLEIEQELSFRLGRYQYWHIVKSIPCDVRDMEAVLEREVSPLHAQGRHIQCYFVLREPKNIIKEKAEPVGWLPGD